MRYSIEPRDVKGYRFLSFAKNTGTHATKFPKNMSNKYTQKLLDSAKKSTADAIKTTSKREIQKTAEATGDLIGDKTVDKITIISKSPKQFHSQNAWKEWRSKTDENETEIPKERYISPEKKTTNYWWIKINIII